LYYLIGTGLLIGESVIVGMAYADYLQALTDESNVTFPSYFKHYIISTVQIYSISAYTHTLDYTSQTIAKIKGFFSSNPTPPRIGGVSAEESAFRIQQSSTQYNPRFYPFTNVDPYQPWYHRYKIWIFGESDIEANTRDAIFRKTLTDWANKADSKGVDFSGIATSSRVGLNLTIPSHTLEESMSDIRHRMRFLSLPPTPNTTTVQNPFDFTLPKIPVPVEGYSPSTLNSPIVIGRTPEVILSPGVSTPLSHAVEEAKAWSDHASDLSSPRTPDNLNPNIILTQATPGPANLDDSSPLHNTMPAEPIKLYYSKIFNKPSNLKSFNRYQELNNDEII
jgi:hypothetical protein